jgi:hypothetical protein
MPWIIGGSAIVGGLIGSRSARSAARGQEAAARYATDEQRRQFDLTREDWRPYRETGYQALADLAGLRNYDPTPDAASVMQEPGYQFGLQQGRNALEGSAAAGGGLYSGQALKELMQFGTDYGTTKFNDAFNRREASFGNRWNRLAGLAGIGQAANQQTTAAGQNYANNVGSIAMGNANAQGAARMAQGNIWGSTFNQLASIAGRGGFGSPGGGGGGYGGGVPMSAGSGYSDAYGPNWWD